MLMLMKEHEGKLLWRATKRPFLPAFEAVAALGHLEWT